jgi:L-ascorbate metabolism protein UlaG (beta-lactamase superfamily)
MEQKKPTDIINEIESTTQLLQGSVALWWLGQAGFVVRGAGMTLLIDPFLSQYKGREVAPPFTAEESSKVDYILCTHEHIDHMDLPTLQVVMRKWTEARIVAPQPIVEQITKVGIAAERVQGVQPGETIKLGDATVFPIEAVHGISFPPVVYNFGLEESGGLYRFLGYAVELNGVTMYHAGDLLIHDGLVQRLQDLHIDLALLPINGRSYFRERLNLVGNIDEREAADLAAAANIPAVIPTHYEMFGANVGRPGFFVDYIRSNHPEMTCYVPAHGKRLVYTK